MSLKALSASYRSSILFLLLACALAASGCGSSGSSSSGFVPNVKPVSTGPLPKSGCGSLPPASKPNDPDGVVAGLPKDHQVQYSDYPEPTLKSAWSGWKPPHPPPYKVGIVWGAITTETQADIYGRLQKQLKASPLIGSVTAKTTGNNLDVGAELQLMRSMLDQGVDLIVIEPFTGDSFLPLMKDAQSKQVPVVTSLGTIDHPAALNLDFNGYTTAADSTARAAMMIGGKGNVLFGTGLGNITPDVQAKKGFEAAMSRCPNMKVAGSILTGFVNSVAKGETLKFLGTHPEPVNLVFATGPFAGGVMQGFDQGDRPMPPVVDIGGTRGAFGYWNKTPGYEMVGEGVPAVGYADGLASVAIRTLQGQSPKLNNLVAPPVLVTRANLKDWVEPGWDVNTPGQPVGPPGQFFGESYINAFFDKPAPPK